MISKVGSCLIVGLVLFVFVLDFFPDGAQVAAAEQDAGSRAQSTRLMQQIDHQRRLREKEAEEAQKQYGVAGASPPEVQEASAGFDLAVFVILAVSAVALFIVCRIRGGSTRRCVFPPGTRPFYRPPGNARSPKSN